MVILTYNIAADFDYNYLYNSEWIQKLVHVASCIGSCIELQGGGQSVHKLMYM